MSASRVLPWLALAAAFSPLLVELGGHLRAEPWALYVLWFALLLPRAIARHGGGAQPRAAGYALVVLALGLQLLALGGEFVRFARPALPLAIVGLCLGQGAAPLRVALLALWCVPVPALVLTAATPALESAQLALVGGGLAALGAPLEVERVAAFSGGAALRLDPGVNGVATLALAAGMGWYAGLRREEPLARTALRSLRWALGAVPVQLAALAAALGLLVASGPGAATGLLLALQLPLGAALALRAERADVGQAQDAR